MSDMHFRVTDDYMREFNVHVIRYGKKSWQWMVEHVESLNGTCGAAHSSGRHRDPMSCLADAMGAVVNWFGWDVPA